MLTKFFSAVAVMTSLCVSTSCNGMPTKTYMPENSIEEDMRASDEVLHPTQVSEQKFNDIILKAQRVFEPIVARHGGKLVISGDWLDATVNASANQVLNIWNVNMFGGLARRHEITPDGFTMVLCHELGHHLGGFSFVAGSSWASNEGNSDYFASFACTKTLWQDDYAINESFRKKVGPDTQDMCDEAWDSFDEQNLCYRTVAAGISTATLLARGRGLSLVNKDPRRVRVTSSSHPQAQCRLDTMLSASLCSNIWSYDIIPGKNVGPYGNRDGLEAEREAARNSCARIDGYRLGVRPLCWYAPKDLDSRQNSDLDLEPVELDTNEYN